MPQKFIALKQNWPHPFPAILWSVNVKWKKTQIEKKTINSFQVILINHENIE